jgi:hypothetical protein
MADQAIVPMSLAPNTVSDALAAVATGYAQLTSSNDGLITPVSDKMVVEILDDGSQGTVTILAGWGAPLAPQGTLTQIFGASERRAVVLESARFKAQGDFTASTGAAKSGETGKIRIHTTQNVKVWAYALP